MPDNLLTPITSVILREQDNLALIFPVNIAKKPTFEMYFFRVARRYPLHMTYDSELNVMAAGEIKDYTFMGESALGTEPDVLTIWEERPFRMLHFAFGIRPSEIWLYRSIPADVQCTGWGYKTPTKVGDKRDYIQGYMSPYDNPTITTETMLYHKLSINIGLKNDAGRALRPSLRLLGAGYDTIQITDENFINAMLAGIKPVRPITVGSLRHFTFSVPEAWQKPTLVDADVVAKLMSRK